MKVQTRVYGREDLVKVAKRDNNEKRPFLLVNPLQGKHLPCSPGDALALFEALAARLYRIYPGKRLLIIGFAETATAIGAAIAACSSENTDYIQTTREEIKGTSSLFFSEIHSHATEQRLVKSKLPELLKRADHIIFAEDEVTTGNTILNAIHAIQKEYGSLPLTFGVVSILNGMTEENLELFRQRGITCTWMLRLNHETYQDQLNRYEYDPSLCFPPDVSPLPENENRPLQHGGLPLKGYLNPRLGVASSDFLTACRAMAESAIARLEEMGLENKDVLVLGTEEFMFPPLLLAAMLEAGGRCRSVRFHATTRSPILPCTEEGYPIVSRFGLKSVYDPDRPTYIYNLAPYDRAVILHDSPRNYEAGLRELCSALTQAGCGDISVFRWGDCPDKGSRGQTEETGPIEQEKLTNVESAAHIAANRRNQR